MLIKKNKIVLAVVLSVLIISNTAIESLQASTVPALEYQTALIEKNYSDSEVIVELESAEDLTKIVEEKNLIAKPLTLPSSDENLYLLKSPNLEPAKDLLSDLQDESAVKNAQLNFKYKPLARTPRDSQFPNQWMHNGSLDTVTGSINTASAWDYEIKKQSRVYIAIIDSGANLKHKDLKDNLTTGGRKGKNFISRKKKPTDNEGHGTMLSGIIAAETDNKRGISGSSFFNNLKVMPLKFDFTTAQAITALEHAKSKGVRIVNASWGGYGTESYDTALKDAIQNFPGIIITAAGNDSINHDSGDPEQRMYPCDFDLANIVCVGASDRNGDLTSYSDYGTTSIDVVAPGGTDGDEILILGPSKSGYGYGVGSSLSAAYVSAEAGLLLSKYPHLSNEQIISIINQSVDLRPSLSGKIKSGGKVNYLKAMQLAATY